MPRPALGQAVGLAVGVALRPGQPQSSLDLTELRVSRREIRVETYSR